MMKTMMAASAEAASAAIAVAKKTAIAATSAEKNTCGDLRCTDKSPPTALEGCRRLGKERPTDDQWECIDGQTINRHEEAEELNR